MELPEISPDKTHHIFAGTPVYSRRFIEVKAFRFPGLAAVHDASGWYHIDFTGTELYPQRYREAGDFCDGTAAVMLDSGRYVYINTRGHQIDPLEFIRAGDFENRIACVYHETLGATHITTAGELLYNEWYYDVRPFINGKAVIRDDTGWKYIDISGTVLGSAPEPDDNIPRGTVRTYHRKNRLAELIASHTGYDACVVLIRHAEREPFYAGEGGSKKQLTGRGIAETKELAEKLPKFAKSYASPILRCMDTARIFSDPAIPDTCLGYPGAFICDDTVSHEFYVENDTVAAVRSYIKGRVLPGHYPVKEGAKYFLTHLCEIAEDGKYILCVTHDAFLIPCISVVSGNLFEDDWMDFLDGCVLFRYGSRWELVWRGGMFPLNI